MLPEVLKNCKKPDSHDGDDQEQQPKESAMEDAKDNDDEEDIEKGMDVD